MKEKSYEVFQIKLPDYLADWLVKISEDFLMTPSQFLTNLLQHYYEIYNKGIENSNLRKQIRIEDLPTLAEDFVKQEKLKGGSTSKVASIVKKFASWAKDRVQSIYELNDDTVNAFLQEYIKDHELTKNTVYSYRSVIKKFIKNVSGNLVS